MQSASTYSMGVECSLLLNRESKHRFTFAVLKYSVLADQAAIIAQWHAWSLKVKLGLTAQSGNKDLASEHLLVCYHFSLCTCKK